uniref:DNA methyltransferase 3 like n=1 Tax=Pipistrellus kuhlii TaxID=59472 RepID=A0A7J7V5N4_PIPKU|nr:DNA methyltransferase 3 like [Pipistrellus kuhlii]
MCSPRKDKFRDYFFLYDDDWYQSSCSICYTGQTLLICENPDCTRCYCFECVDTPLGPGTSEKVQAMSKWVCFLKELTSLGFLENGARWARLKYLEDVTEVVRRSVEEWGPFDLVLGFTPPLRQASGRTPGWYIFQYHRILEYALTQPSSSQPFFWMFVDNLMLTEAGHPDAKRFLEMDAVTILDSCGRAIRNALHVWSNIPAMRSRHSAGVTWEELSLLAQDQQRTQAVAAAGLASLVKKCFLPLREYFKYFQPN